MPRDSNGVASTDPVYLAVSGETIRSVQHNTPIEDIVNMLTGSLARNGTGGMNAALQMGGFKVQGVADGTLSNDAAAFGQLSTSLASYSNPANLTGAVKVGGAFTRSGIISPAQITADTNDYAPTGLDTCAVMRVNSNAARTITGLVAPTTNPDGREIRLVNIGSYSLTLTSESASSTAANRFALSAALVIPAFGAIDLIYDSTTSRWRALASVQVTSDVLPGSPTTTTQTASDSSPKVATTAHVHAAINNDFNVSGSAPKYAVRAWVKFQGDSGIINASGNVSSVTVYGTGNYYINLSTAMPDSAYVINGIVRRDGGDASPIVNGDPSTTGFGIIVKAYNADYYSPSRVFLSVVR